MTIEQQLNPQGNYQSCSDTKTDHTVVPSKVPFNLPYLTGRETDYIKQTVLDGHTAGNGGFTKKCHAFFKERFGFSHNLLTSSCTDALEMAALLLDVTPNDEVIVPSYTFVSTANAFALRGARIRFADSLPSSPNVDPHSIERQITPKTKAIVVVHYSGIACDMERILALGRKYEIPIVEDAAHSIDSYWNGKPLGSLGALSTFSFHETKNIISGEGGLLVVNDPRYVTRSEVLWEKGTNRTAFARGEVQKYLWLDVGSSFLPSEVIAAFLFSQLESMEEIQKKRVALWRAYANGVAPLVAAGHIQIPEIPPYASINGHLFAVITKSHVERDALMDFLKARGIFSVFHYLPLHLSPFAARYGEPDDLPHATRYGECLIRLPFFYKLTIEEVNYVCRSLREFYENNR